MTEPVTLAADRSIAVPPGQVIKTGYVPIEHVSLACKDRMAIGDVKEAYERQLQLGDKQAWPCPRGHWSDEGFVIVDGRHAFVAALMLGLSHIFVAWLEEAP